MARGGTWAGLSAGMLIPPCAMAVAYAETSFGAENRCLEPSIRKFAHSLAKLAKLEKVSWRRLFEQVATRFCALLPIFDSRLHGTTKAYEPHAHTKFM